MPTNAPPHGGAFATPPPAQRADPLEHAYPDTAMNHDTTRRTRSPKPWLRQHRLPLLAALDGGLPLPHAATTSGLPYPSPPRTDPFIANELHLVDELHARGIPHPDIAELLGRDPRDIEDVAT